jgi:farnesyl diphosphate synthase
MMGNHAVFGDNYGQKGAVSEADVNELYKAHFLGRIKRRTTRSVSTTFMDWWQMLMIMMVLDLFFGEKEYYSDLIDLFYGTSPKTEIGQLLDLITAPEDTVTDDAVNFEKYCLIVRYQTAYYSLYLPFALAMYMAGHATPENLKQIKDALIPLEAYSQIQDDYLHCWGKPEYIGDPIIGNPAVFGENYGQKGAGAEQDFNELYKAHFLMAHYKA